MTPDTNRRVIVEADHVADKLSELTLSLWRLDNETDIGGTLAAAILHALDSAGRYKEFAEGEDDFAEDGLMPKGNGPIALRITVEIIDPSEVTR